MTVDGINVPSAAPTSHSKQTKPWSRTDALSTVAIGAITLLAFGVRLYHLAEPNITPDEWFILRIARQGALWYLDLTSYFEPHPPLYPFSFMVVTGAAGESEFAMRFLSVFCGVLAVVAVYDLGKTLLDRRAGLIAALLLAVNPYQVDQSQNARNYAMVTALAVIATYCLVVAIRKRDRRYWVAYALACIGMLYVHYNSGLIWLAHAVLIVGGCILVTGWRRNVLRPWLLSQVAVGVVVLPWIVHNSGALLAYQGYFPERLTPLELLQRTLLTYTAGQQHIGRVGYALAIAVAILALVGLVYTWHRQKRLTTAVVGLSVIVPLGLGIILFMIHPMFEERYLIVLAPAYALLAAFGLVAILRFNRVLGGLTILAVIAASGYTLNAYYPEVAQSHSDYRGLAHWVDTTSQPGDVIITTGNSVAELFSYYHRGSIPLVLAADKEQTAAVIQEVLAKRPTGIWLLPYADTEADHIANDLLSRQAFATTTRWQNGTHCCYFAVGDPLPAPQPSNAVWAGQLRLMEWSAGSLVEPGQTLCVRLLWQAIDKINADYKVSLRLYNQDSQLISQHDRQPLNSLSPTTIWSPNDQVEDNYGIVVPFGTAPGSYRLEIVVYDAANGDRAAVSTGPGAGQSALDLGTVQVSPITRQMPADVLETNEPAHILTPNLSLLSHYVTTPEPRTGEDMVVAILWRAPLKPSIAYSSRLELIDSQGNTVAAADAPVGSDHPTSTWIAGEAIRQFYRLPISPNAPGGTHRLVLRLSDYRGQSISLPGAVNDAVELETVNVTAPSHSFTAPAVPSALKNRFGSAQLLGYDLSPKALQAGEAVTLTLYWQALGHSDQSYTVFVHLLDADGRLGGQKDQIPLAGQRPTTSWVAGEYLVDTYELPVDPASGEGDYSLELGLYNASTGKRLPAYDDAGNPVGDHITISGLTIGK